MRLVRRLVLYLLLAVGAIFAIDALSGVRSHLAIFDEGARHDERDLASALTLPLERAWRERGATGATELLASIGERIVGTRVRVVYLDADSGDPLAPDVPRRALKAVRRDRTVTHVRREGEPEARLYTYVPLDVPGDRLVALEVSESLSHEREYLADRITRTLTTAAVMVLASGLVAWLVGARVVGRPVEALVAKARRIGRGDFGGPLVLGQRDELSLLAAEMNAMATALDAAARRVADESAARLRALDQLRHADRLTTVGKLASGLAHELGTPLNVVAGRAKMITTGEIDGTKESIENAQIILDQAERMTRIVRQLLDFARRGTAEKKKVDLGVLTRQTARLLEALAAKRGISIACNPTAEPACAQLDPAQIQQAITNLVVNAVHASADGDTVEISVSRREASAERRGGDAGERWVVVEVRDRGTGIPDRALTEIFDPFFTTKPVGEGTGLGLSVAHGIAVEHGGWIDVESEPDRGSCFRLWLPEAAA